MKKAVEEGQRWDLARAQKSSFCPNCHLDRSPVLLVCTLGLGHQRPRKVEGAEWAVGFRVMGTDTRQGGPSLSAAAAAGPELGDRLCV